MNEHYRTILNAQIQKAVTDARSAQKIEHPYLTGKLREIVLQKMIEPVLNSQYSLGTGKAMDYLGTYSKEIDICIYSNALHPPFFFSEKEGLGIFPIESVLSCVEVKSTFNKKTLRDAFHKFRFQEDNLMLTTGYHGPNEEALPHIIIRPKYSYFAFSCEAKKYTAETFLKIYKDIDPHWNSAPLITSVCLAGKGWFCFTQKGWLHLEFDTAKQIHEEVIGFLGTLVHDLPRAAESRGVPRIGYYLTDPLSFDKLVEGKLIKRPWVQGQYRFQNTTIE